MTIKSSVLRQGAKGKLLYAIVYNRRDNRGRFIYQNTEYVNAIDVGDAKFQFLSAFYSLRERPQIEIVGIAPAVGFFTTDEHGDNVIT